MLLCNVSSEIASAGKIKQRNFKATALKTKVCQGTKSSQS